MFNLSDDEKKIAKKSAVVSVVGLLITLIAVLCRHYLLRQAYSGILFISLSLALFGVIYIVVYCIGNSAINNAFERFVCAAPQEEDSES